MFFKQLLVFCVLTATQVLAKDDGLARTPPMGWISWVQFECETDCEKHPKACINDELYREHADRLVADGFKELGYEYVNIDDCWSEKERDSNHKLVADKKRFPHGMKGLADYVHSKGLKLGTYGDVGTSTCAGYPSQKAKNGSNYFKIDAKTFAEWGIDSFKFDCCHSDGSTMNKDFPEMGQALSESGRKILFSCEWPLYKRTVKGGPDYDAITKTCHVFRNWHDVDPKWSMILGTINFYGENNEHFMKYNGPGHFFDPDMLVIGMNGINYEQAKTQMSMWSMWSAPLMMSNDLRHLSKELKAILQNKAVIAIDQDKHGLMAKRVINNNSTQVWVKSVEPEVKGTRSYAVMYLNTHESGNSVDISHKVSELIPNLKAGIEFTVHDLYKEENGKEIIGTLKANDNLSLKVAPKGGSRMVKLIPK